MISVARRSAYGSALRSGKESERLLRTAFFQSRAASSVGRAPAF
jgi:hypothetical protein